MVISTVNFLTVIVERAAIFNKLNVLRGFKMSNISVDKFPHNTAMLPSLDLSNKPADEIENIDIDSTCCRRTNGIGKDFFFQ